MSKNLCTGTQTKGIAVHHPGSVMRDVALADSSKAET